uniref:ANK_REP_REGION domain-containing protein n=1 Tax=Rhabditophanes sp. KR3021 TaxID=114890 RepID=A0AC35TP28_9BILA
MDPWIDTHLDVDPLTKCIRKGHTAQVKMMVSHDYLLSCKSNPLHEAIYLDHIPILKLLIDHKADLSNRSPSGLTALELATSLKRKECIRMLIDAGADKKDAKLSEQLLTCKSTSNANINDIGKMLDCNVSAQQSPTTFKTLASVDICVSNVTNIAQPLINDHFISITNNEALINNTMDTKEPINESDDDGGLVIDEDPELDEDKVPELPEKEVKSKKKGKKRPRSARLAEPIDVYDFPSSTEDTSVENSQSEESFLKKVKITEESEQLEDAPKKVQPIKIRRPVNPAEDDNSNSNGEFNFDKPDTSFKSSARTPKTFRRMQSELPDEYTEERNSDGRVTRAKARKSGIAFEDSATPPLKRRRNLRASTIGPGARGQSKSPSPLPVVVPPKIEMIFSESVETPPAPDNEETLAQPHASTGSGPSTFSGSIVYSLFDMNCLDAALKIESMKAEAYKEQLEKEASTKNDLTNYNNFLTFTKNYRERKDYPKDIPFDFPPSFLEQLTDDLYLILKSQMVARQKLSKQQQVDRDRFVLGAERDYFRAIKRTQFDSTKAISIVRIIAENNLYNPQHFDKDASDFVPNEEFKKETIEKKLTEAKLLLKRHKMESDCLFHQQHSELLNGEKRILNRTLSPFYYEVKSQLLKPVLPVLVNLPFAHQ